MDFYIEKSDHPMLWVGRDYVIDLTQKKARSFVDWWKNLREKEIHFLGFWEDLSYFPRLSSLNLEEAIRTAIPVRRVVREGKGYSGGHETAARMGWEIISPPMPKLSEELVFWWNSTETGRFTGCYPSKTEIHRI